MDEHGAVAGVGFRHMGLFRMDTLIVFTPASELSS